MAAANVNDNDIVDLTLDDDDNDEEVDDDDNEQEATSNSNNNENNKKRSIDSTSSHNHQVSKKMNRRPTLVYIVCTCNYPLQNDKWGENSGHDTEDTEILAVYASLKDANRRAKEEKNLDYDDDGDDDDKDSENEDDDDDDDLFYWQDDEPYDWTARRVWVEEKTIQY